MLNIAPLDYERWAVLVSPLLVPGAPHVEAKPPPRHAEHLGPVSAALSGTGSRAGEGLREPVSRLMGLRRKTLERDQARPLNEPHPTDLSLLFPLPNGIFNSAQNQPAIDPRIVMELYDHPENTRGTTVRISG